MVALIVEVFWVILDHGALSKQGDLDVLDPSHAAQLSLDSGDAGAALHMSARKWGDKGCDLTVIPPIRSSTRFLSSSESLVRATCPSLSRCSTTFGRDSMLVMGDNMEEATEEMDDPRWRFDGLGDSRKLMMTGACLARVGQRWRVSAGGR